MTFDNDIPRVEGLMEGNSGEDVGRLQRYLEKFGYLSSPRLDVFGVPREMAAAPEPQPGTFDQNTATALRAFQEKFGMPVTGVLDQATLELMSKPRCGFPDVAAYSVQGNKWGNMALTYGFNEFTPDLTQSEVRSAVTEAFGLWSAVIPVTFTEVPVANSPDIVIRFAGGDHGDGFPFDMAGGVLAHAFYPPPNLGALSGDAHFDEDETWAVAQPPPASTFDLVTVAAHEFGHSLGLGHSMVPGSLMYPTYSGVHRSLHADDVAGIQFLYQDWEDVGGVLTDGVGVCGRTTKPGSPVIYLVVFGVGTDRTMWLRGWMSGFGWNQPWVQVDGELYSAPAAVFWEWQPPPGVTYRYDIVGLGGDRALWHKWFDGSAVPPPPTPPWSEWESLEGFWTDGVAISSWAAHRVDCFAVGKDRALWHRFWDGSSWSEWGSLGGELYSAPAAVSWGPNRIDVVGLGIDRAVWHTFWDGSSWATWESLGGFWTQGVGLSSWGQDRLDCFAVGTDRALWHKAWNGASWSNWQSVGGEIYSVPAAVSVRPGRIDIFALGGGRQVLHKWHEVVP